MDENSTAYNEGFEAYFQGLEVEDNPYGELTQNFRDWDTGFFEAGLDEE